MLNTSTLNGKMVNGAAAMAALVFASATFTAEATLTPAPDATIVKAGEGAWSASAPSTDFIANQIHAAIVDIEASASTQFQCFSVNAAQVDWSAAVDALFFTNTPVKATADWSAGVTFDIVPNDTLGVVNWTATATLDDEGYAIFAAAGSWDASADWDLEEGTITQTATADWSGSATALWEPTVTTSGGDVTHDATIIWTASAELETDLDLISVEVSAWRLQGTADIAIAATVIAGGQGTWEAASTFTAEGVVTKTDSVAWNGDATFDVVGNVNQVATVDWEHIGSFMTIHSLQDHAGIWNPEGNATMEMTTTVMAYGWTDWLATADLTGIGVREVQAEGNFIASLAWEAPLSTRTAQGTVDWDANASQLTLSGVLRLVPAPEHRRLVFSGDSRDLIFSGGSRDLAFSGRKQNSEVSS